MNCRQAIRLIHEWLDEDTTPSEEQQLKQHLLQCGMCRELYQSLQHTIAFVQSASHVYAPQEFTDRVMAALPRETASQIWKRKLQRHPFLVAASLFILLMTGSTFANWTEDHQFQLSASQWQKLEINKEQSEVIVPVNSVVNGDIVVRNANITVKGQVEGNVVAVDGHIYLASTGSIAGEREEIHQAVEWVWYNIKKLALALIP